MNGKKNPYHDSSLQNFGIPGPFKSPSKTLGEKNQAKKITVGILDFSIAASDSRGQISSKFSVKSLLI